MRKIIQKCIEKRERREAFVANLRRLCEHEAILEDIVI
jgi:hypothetical protein